MPNRQNQRGRSKNPDGQYWPLTYYLLKHEAWRGLSGKAIKVLCELRRRYTVKGDGKSNNNGRITLSLDEGARLLHMGKTTVQRALKELEAAGFIIKTRQGQWYGRMATEWRLTEEPYKGEPPTRDWQNIAKAKKQNSVPERSISSV
jgi:DNA-binding MarR family transcriptional regulator